MSRGDRNFIATAVGCLIGAAILWALLKPGEPRLRGYEQAQQQDSAYRPGGSACDPLRLIRLPADSGARERDACAESAEQHRLQSNDLIQQTRAADAARASVVLNYGQSLMILAGTIIGLLTLAAAVAAAIFAKRAAEETRRGADAADKGLERARDANLLTERAINLTQQAMEADNRAWLDFEIVAPPEYMFTWEGDNCVLPLNVVMKNYGSSPALSASIRQNISITPRTEQQIISDCVKENIMQFSAVTIFPGGWTPPTCIEFSFNPTESEFKNNLLLTIIVWLDYYTIFDTIGTNPRKTFKAYQVRWNKHSIPKSQCPIPVGDLQFLIHPDNLVLIT